MPLAEARMNSIIAYSSLLQLERNVLSIGGNWSVVNGPRVKLGGEGGSLQGEPYAPGLCGLPFGGGRSADIGA